ncbi:MAG TPA: hypothetical protein QF665_03305 [Alphaproteobacteria bacterium]|nr:hypothetical protein [Alphaproteobacteria bacterium]
MASGCNFKPGRKAFDHGRAPLPMILSGLKTLLETGEALKLAS